MTGLLYDLPEVVTGMPPERTSKYGSRLEIQPVSVVRVFGTFERLN